MPVISIKTSTQSSASWRPRRTATSAGWKSSWRQPRKPLVKSPPRTLQCLDMVSPLLTSSRFSQCGAGCKIVWSAINRLFERDLWHIFREDKTCMDYLLSFCMIYELELVTNSCESLLMLFTVLGSGWSPGSSLVLPEMGKRLGPWSAFHSNGSLFCPIQILWNPKATLISWRKTGAL